MNQLIQNLVEGAIRRRVFVVLCFILVSFACIFSFQNIRVDAIPDIGENQQIVFSQWPGRSPKDVEEQLTYPLASALQGLPGIKGIRGTSAFGFSSISIIFNDDIDFYWSRSRVLEKLSSLGPILPSGVTPSLGPDSTGLGQVFMYTLENSPGSERKLSLDELRSLQDFYVKLHLQAAPGVSEVASVGGFVKEYQIDVDPRKLLAYDIHFTGIIKAIENSNLDVGAEVIEDGEREMVVRGVGFFRSLRDIENVVVGIKEGTPVRVQDLASVGNGPSFRRGSLDKSGQESVGGVVTMRYGANPQEVIDAVKKKIADLESGLPEGVKIVPFYDRTELIQKTLGTVYSALAQEIVITIAVVMLFLLHFRSSILISLTLPFGVGISFILMKFFEVDSNIMSLSGLVIAIGTMVDMGIIITENIYSALATQKPKDSKERIEVIVESAREVAGPILTAVLTTIITFIPVFALEGAEGKLFGPLAWAKTLAMFGAVVVSILLVPVLSVYFLKGELRPIESNRVSREILKNYQPALRMILKYRKVFLLLPFFIVVLGAASFFQLGKEFMPSLNEGTILYMPVTTPAVSMSKARELLAYTDEVIAKHPLVDSVVGKLGRAQSALDPAPISMIETVVNLIPEDQWPDGTDIYKIMQELDESLQVPGLVNAWLFPIENRVAMISTGIKTPVGIKIFGPKLEVLEELGAKIAKVMEGVEGAYGVYAEQIAGKPYVEFHVDRLAASRYGINTGDVGRIIQTAVGGMAIGQFYDGRERFPIRLRYKKEFRNDIEELKRVLVPSPLGLHVPLGSLADVKIVTGPSMIQSENGLLRSTVLLNVRDRDVIGLVNEGMEKVAKEVVLPPGYSISWAGQWENQVRANERLLWLVPLSLFINLILIYLGLGKLRDAAIVFTAIPVAAAGGMMLLFLTSTNTSVAVWVGFIALFGIAVDDGVVLMSYIQSERRKLKPKNLTELFDVVENACSRRIRPLLMTTATTLCALLPVMWSTGTGSEIMRPMAIPVLGGMTIELITLFVVPVIYTLFEERNLNKGDENV